MSYTRTSPGGLILTGEQKISLTATTPVAVNSTVRSSGKCSKLLISVETANVRMRFGSTNPTMTTGILIFANTQFERDGYDGTSLLKFCRSTGLRVVTIAGFKSVGQP